MAKQVADVQIHASESQDTFEDDNLDVSVDLIDERLYLGMLQYLVILLVMKLIFYY